MVTPLYRTAFLGHYACISHVQTGLKSCFFIRIHDITLYFMQLCSTMIRFYLNFHSIPALASIALFFHIPVALSSISDVTFYRYVLYMAATYQVAFKLP